MARPGVEVISRDQPAPKSAPTDTGVWFVVGQTVSGTAGDPPKLITSMAQYEAAFGARSGAGIGLYDALDTYFREGGAKAYVVKVAAAGEVAGLAKFDSALGPGQVSIPGLSTAAVHDALLDHAELHNRVALLDTAAAPTAAALDTMVDLVRALPNARYGALFGPHAIVPGVTPGTTRTVPYSAIEAGILGRNDAAMNANVAAAGINGQSLYATDLAAFYTDAEYETLNEAGVCMARLIYGGVRTYGYRTAVDPVGADAEWLSFGNSRLYMQIAAQAEAIGEGYVFSQLDGRRKRIAQFGGELRAMLVPFYESDALYGATADDAFSVNVGDQVNTEESIAAGELRAVLSVRMSPFSEKVVIEIVKIATTEAIAA